MIAGSISLTIDTQPARRVRRPRHLPKPLLRQVLEQAVTQVFTVPRAELWSQRRGRPAVAFARQVAMYLAHVCCGLNLKEVGRIFGRDRTTVAHACCVVEDRRDEPSFDRALELIEGVLRFLSSASMRVN
jgi:chromosomal replication initiation ATPase DnaA